MSQPPVPSPGVLRTLLLLASLGLTGTVVCGVGWYLMVSRQVEIEDLGPVDRQRLVEDLFDVSGRAFTPAWFEPRIAYTLRRRADLSVWNDAFTSNSLGYRAGTVEKSPGVLRVVFIGDSWTYGMGVSLDEAFPKQFEALANDLLPTNAPRVEAWPLALPGYNTMNQTAALELFFDRIQPDVAVFCPTRNDADSNFFVMPNGSSKRASGTFIDRFGSDHSLQYRGYRFLDSFRYEERWRKSFGTMKEIEDWLSAREIPLVFFFVAFWEEAFVHREVERAGIASHYVVGPQEILMGKWRGPPPWYHGTPDAYAIYARMAYRTLGTLLDWPELARNPDLDLFELRLFDRTPPGNWEREAAVAVRQWTMRVPTEWQVGRKNGQCPGTVDCVSGMMGRATTILVRRKAHSETIRVAFEKLPESRGHYPFQLSVAIPSIDGGTRATTWLRDEDPAEGSLSIDLPRNVPPDRVLDIEIRSSRATLSPEAFVLQSVRILSVTQD